MKECWISRTEKHIHEEIPYVYIYMYEYIRRLQLRFSLGLSDYLNDFSPTQKFKTLAWTFNWACPRRWLDMLTMPSRLGNAFKMFTSILGGGILSIDKIQRSLHACLAWVLALSATGQLPCRLTKRAFATLLFVLDHYCWISTAKVTW